MDWKHFKPLLVEQTQKLLQLSLKSQMAAQPPEVEKVLATLHDGSIDPGDSEDVARGLLRIIVAMPEYQALVQFTRERRGEFAALYRSLADATEDDFSSFIELGQTALNLADDDGPPHEAEIYRQ